MFELACAFTTSAAGNWAGLFGTALLAIAALRVLPLGKRLYRINSALLNLAEQRRLAHKAPAAVAEGGPRVDEPAGLEALQQRLDEHDSAYAQLLGDASTTLSTRKDKLTRLDAAITIAGLLLTLASDALPLAAAFCQPAGTPSGSNASVAQPPQSSSSK